MLKKSCILASLLLALVAHSKAGYLGLTPLASVGPAVATYTDSTVSDGQGYAYWVTAAAAACPAAPSCGESGVSGFVIAIIPATGSHSVSLAWTPSTSPGVVTQNIYRVPVPLAPSGLSVTVN
jgi:hypothetical protein